MTVHIFLLKLNSTTTQDIMHSPALFGSHKLTLCIRRVLQNL